MNYYQQGDVLIKPVDSLPAWRQSEIEERNKKEVSELILAEGETTGHAHKITGKIVHYIPKYNSDTMVFELVEDVTITHEEHGSFVIPAGKYFIEQVREFDHFSNQSRNVRD